MPSVGVVSAFVGPLIAAIIGVGTFSGWIIKRSNDRMKDAFANFGALNDERLKALAKILEAQARTLEQQQKQVMDTSISVARIEGKLSNRNVRMGEDEH